jgi:hypothetical protein
MHVGQGIETMSTPKRWDVRLLLFFCTFAQSQTCSAQVIAEFNSGIGKFFGGIEIGKTTDIGRFDDYVGPALATGIRSFFRPSNRKASYNVNPLSISQVPNRNSRIANSGNSLGINQVSDFIRGGDKNLGLKYVGRLGWTFTIGYETSSFLKFENKGLRVSFFKGFDANLLKAFAPQGVGILTDPTAFEASVMIKNTGLSVEAPINNTKSKNYDFTSYLGFGIIKNRTRSHGLAKSDFLDISIIETRVINRPLISYAYRIRPILNDYASTTGFDLKVQLYRTSKMYNTNFTLALIKMFP